MAPNPKVVAAYRAMASLGISESQVKPVLKKLLKLYDKNWELIEEGSYRALADAIFEADASEEPEHPKKNKRVHEEEAEAEEALINVEPVQPLKRLRLRGQENNSTSSAPSPSKKPHIEKATAPEGSSAQQQQNKAVSSDGNTRIAARPAPMQDASSDRGKQPALPQDSLRGRKPVCERASPSKQTTVQPGRLVLPNNQMPHANALIIPKDEPVDESPDYELPIAMVPPGIQ